jgi:hypothetical protein
MHNIKRNIFLKPDLYFIEKTMHTYKLLYLFNIFIIFSISACFPSSANKEDSGVEPSATARAHTSDCGTVVEGVLHNPITDEAALTVNVTAITTDTVIVTLIENGVAVGDRLVRLHGVTSEGISNSSIEDGKAIINRLGRNALFIPVSESCVAHFPGGGQGVYGQIYSNSGVAINEALIQARAVQPDFSAPCNSSLVTACYQALKEIVGEELSPISISRFLWKPVAERDGNLVVLTDRKARIYANGQELHDHGPSNGFGTTARANRPGCAFGTNVRVEAFDSSDRRMKILGEDTFIVRNGCDRVQVG